METTYSNFNILIIDDDDVYRQFLRFTLELTLNCKIYDVAAPKEALELLNKETISLILLDLELPQMDGYSLLRLIRMSDLTKKIPVIVCSALRKKELIIEISKWNISDYIVKGINKKELLQKIQNVLDKLLN